MRSSNKNTLVAILISTMNRPDFMIRELSYYAEVNSPHPIYIADSSNEENANILKRAIQKFESKLKIIYRQYPPGEDCTKFLLKLVKEKYACLIGDDDYQIPRSLTKCAEFLEENPDYNLATGQAVSFRLKNNSVYGELGRVADYPRQQIENNTASERLVAIMRRYYTSTFGVSPVKTMQKIWDYATKANDPMNEIIPTCLYLVYGKSKVLDCLSLVRQIHSTNNYLPDTFDWLSSKNFSDSYEKFKSAMVSPLVTLDNISSDQAERVAKQALWSFSETQLAREYSEVFPSSYPKKQKSKLKLIKTSLGRRLPYAKRIYMEFISKNKPIHYEVMSFGSEYSKDFGPIIDSFTGKYLK